MKKLNKIFALLMAVAMVFAFAACNNGGSEGGNNNAQTADNPYNLDYTSDALQPMTDERASSDVLLESGKYYMDGLANSPADFSKLTYKDLAEHIGVDASEYQHFESWGQDRYTWYVEGNSGASLLAVFDFNGNLTSVSSSVG